MEKYNRDHKARLISESLHQLDSRRTNPDPLERLREGNPNLFVRVLAIRASYPSLFREGMDADALRITACLCVADLVRKGELHRKRDMMAALEKREVVCS